MLVLLLGLRIKETIRMERFTYKASTELSITNVGVLITKLLPLFSMDHQLKTTRSKNAPVGVKTRVERRVRAERFTRRSNASVGVCLKSLLSWTKLQSVRCPCSVAACPAFPHAWRPGALRHCSHCCPCLRKPHAGHCPQLCCVSHFVQFCAMLERLYT